MTLRQTVKWVGFGPSEAIAESFRSRGLVLRESDTAACVAAWNSARAAVFWNPTDADLTVLCEGELANALAHGVCVRIVVPFEDLARRRDQLKTLSFLDDRWLKVEDTAGMLAEEFARHDPGPAHDSRVQLRGNNEWSNEERVLLQRAFYDCSEVHLDRMPDGTAKVFIAYAKLTDSRVGPYPLPLFVKIDWRGRAERERSNYGECTTTFVPFYARPNLHLTRCLMGADRGMIVGDFVERSDSLLDLVQRGNAQSAIDSLFHDALRGWRAQPHVEHHQIIEAKLYTSCVSKKVLDRNRDRLEIYSKEAKRLGSRLGVFELVRQLDSLPRVKHRRGWIHGDLHCANVRARAGEAILIDFHSVGPGALSTDPATLEVSLALEFECDEADWQATMTELYSVGNLKTVPRPLTSMNPGYALWDAVRQIRRYGLEEQVDEYEYCQAVAIQLLRKATHRRNADEQISRRPFLIKLAAELAAALQRQSAANVAALVSS